jgi:hypothetical protein
MKTFLIDHCPSAALKCEVRRRSLTIVGRLDTCEHPEHPGDPGWMMTPCMVDENPVWVLDVSGGSEFIWECDRPAFDAKLLEYGKRPDRIRRTSLRTATEVGMYDREGNLVTTTRDVEVIACYLGPVGEDANCKCSAGGPNPPSSRR